ncbi:MAG: Tn3 family transposase, partial [Desulfobacteraceae bacterium]
MQEVTQEEMHKVFSDYLEILKEDFELFRDEYPDDVRQAYELAIKAYEVIADADVGDGNLRKAIFAKVPLEKLEWAGKVIDQWHASKNTKTGQGNHESIYKDINGVQTLVSIDRQRGFELETPLPETDHVERFTKLFPRKKISLLDVFNSIDTATHFLDAFVPFDFHYRAKKPEPIYFYAALIERTTRISFKKIVKKVGDINKKKLDDTSRIFLTLDNVRRANDMVVRYIDEMEISSIPETGFDPYHFD